MKTVLIDMPATAALPTPLSLSIAWHLLGGEWVPWDEAGPGKLELPSFLLLTFKTCFAPLKQIRT